MSHSRDSRPQTDELDAEFAREVADQMQALGTASRLRILGRLRAGACSVGELASAIGMQQSAVSHQLRVLRHLGWVRGDRVGRLVVYELHDEHVGQLLDEAVSHVEHLRLAHSGPARSGALAEAR